MKIKYKVILFSISLLLIGCVFLGTSYSMWVVSSTQSVDNTVNVGCFSVTFTDKFEENSDIKSADINLENTYAISDDKGAALMPIPYTFTIKNECNMSDSYQVNLEQLDSGANNVLPNYLRVEFNGESPKNLNTFASAQKGISSSIDSRLLTTGLLTSGQSVTYTLRMWVDYNATVEQAAGKKYHGKVVVINTATLEGTPDYDGSTPATVEPANSENALAYLKNKFMVDTSDLENDGTADNNIRFVGANPKNYITFNGETAGWRIIGVINNKIKIVRSSALENRYSWDLSDADVNGGTGVNNWATSDIANELNSGTYWTSSLSATAKNQIQSVTWHVGSNGNNDYNIWTVPNMYTYENSDTAGNICTSGPNCTDSVERSTTWDGYVGLLTPSDYGFAINGSARSKCLTTNMYNWKDDSDCLANNWLKSGTDEWTMIPRGSSSSNNNVFYITSNGFVNGGQASGNVYIRPVVYLNDDIVISGAGTIDNPFTIQ